jgi:transposase InsO family protein
LTLARNQSWSSTRSAWLSSGAARSQAKRSFIPITELAQFRSASFVAALKDHGLTGSMGRVGACGDNAAMESFFALLQKNVLDRQRWSGREQLRLAIITWIEKTCHRRRRQRGLGRLTPVEYETINQAAHAA